MSSETPEAIPTSLSITEAADFTCLKQAVLDKEVLIHPERQTKIEVADVVSTIEDVEVAITLGATRQDLRNKIQAVTKTEGIRGRVIDFVLKVRPDIK